MTITTDTSSQRANFVLVFISTLIFGPFFIKNATFFTSARVQIANIPGLLRPGAAGHARPGGRLWLLAGTLEPGVHVRSAAERRALGEGDEARGPRVHLRYLL